MKDGLGLDRLLGILHVYPTIMEANECAADACKRASEPAKLLADVRRALARRRGGVPQGRAADGSGA